MKTLVVSDVAYNELYSRRKGREAISKTLMRELKPAKKSALRNRLDKLSKEPARDFYEVVEELGY